MRDGEIARVCELRFIRGRWPFARAELGREPACSPRMLAINFQSHGETVQGLAQKNDTLTISSQNSPVTAGSLGHQSTFWSSDDNDRT